MGVGAVIGRPVGKVRRSFRRGGADQSGLANVLEMSIFSTAGDALVTVSLASSQFLSVQPGEARSKVALYLLVTMAPFALLAPVVGPTLDRFPHGRRIALGVTLLARAALALTLARHFDEIYLYPLALGLLVGSRAFGVARSAVVPRVLPEGVTLVKANSKITLTGVLTGLVVAPIGYGISELFGYQWTLRLAALVFAVGLFLAWVLPPHVDSAAGEVPARSLGRATIVPGTSGRFRRLLGALPAALRTATAVRALVGFLTLFLAFRLREEGGGLEAIALLGAAAALGSGIGVFLAGQLRKARPELLLVLAILMSGGGCVAAAVIGTVPLFLVAVLLTTMAGSMAKLGLDAVIQRDIEEQIRNSAFARSETALQLSWVIGGAVGLIPFPGRFGFILGAALMVFALFAEVSSMGRSRRDARVSDAGTSGPEGSTPAAGYGEASRHGGASGYGYADAPRYGDAYGQPPRPPAQGGDRWDGHRDGYRDRYGREDDRYGREGDRYGREGDRYGREGDRYGREDDRYGREDDRYRREDDRYRREDDRYRREDDRYRREDDPYGGTRPYRPEEGDPYGRTRPYGPDEVDTRPLPPAEPPRARRRRRR